MGFVGDEPMIPKNACPLIAALFLATWTATVAEPGDSLSLHTRRRVETPPGSGVYRVVEETRGWDAKKTAIVICDMWDQHWCKGASRRVAEMAPRINQVVQEARKRGILIIHAPSDTMKFYEGTPELELARAAPAVAPKTPLLRWCNLDPQRETTLPIDDSDGGCDDIPQCKTGSAWTRQIKTIQIQPGDAVTDSAEAYYLLQQRRIENVIVMGVHLNMCVLGRPFAVRQMLNQGKNVLLMRDLTDTMYNSRKRPFVSHFAGTDLMIEHVEKYLCPTITSVDFGAPEPFRFSEDTRSHPQTITIPPAANRLIPPGSSSFLPRSTYRRLISAASSP